MGKKDETKFELPKNSSLIDFLYIDKERVDSLISQLRNGTLRSVTKTIGASEGSVLSGKGKIPVLSGQVTTKNKSKEEASEEYDPYHSQIIELLNDLSIAPLNELPEQCSGELVCIHAPIKIRDLHSIKKLIPVMEKNSRFFKLAKARDIKDTLKVMNDMVQAMNDAIELSIKFESTLINGTLREGCLSIQQSNLNRMYGTDMPGHWYILGILDTHSTSLINALMPNISDSIESIIDACTIAINQMYSHAQYGIVPILIYREITYDSHDYVN